MTIFVIELTEEGQLAAFKNHFDRRLDYISGDINFLMRKYFQHDEELRELRQAK